MIDGERLKDRQFQKDLQDAADKRLTNAQLQFE
jgi:hypothetical protein